MVNLNGGAGFGPLELDGNTLRSGISLPQRGNYTIRNNKLLDAIWVGSSDIADWGDPGPDPIIEGNSFLGKHAIYGGIVGFNWPKPIQHKIPLGCNFFGTPRGIPRPGTIIQFRWSRLSCTIKGPRWTIRGPRGSMEGQGTSRPTRYFQKFGPRDGSSVKTHSTMINPVMGTRTVSLWTAIPCSAWMPATVPRYRVLDFMSLQWKNHRESTNGRPPRPGHLSEQRWVQKYGQFYPAARCPGQEAVNLSFEVYADISQVGGDLGKPGNTNWLAGGSIKCVPPPKRKFKVSVSPVHVYGLCSGKGSTSDILANIKDYLGAMFPIVKRTSRSAWETLILSSAVRFRQSVRPVSGRP